MAKAKTNKTTAGGRAKGSKTQPRRPAASGTGGRAAVEKGEGLEVGNARRESGRPVAPLPRAVAKEPARKVSDAQLPGEKAVKRTSRSLPVEPDRPSPGEREPLPAAAVDRRRDVVGTDEKGRRGRR